MSRYKDVKDDLKINRCDFCGEKRVDGVWAGKRMVAVCDICATDILPKLIADAHFSAWNHNYPMPFEEMPGRCRKKYDEAISHNYRNLIKRIINNDEGKKLSEILDS